MISKELLSEVLKKELPLNSLGFNFCNVERNRLNYGVEFSFSREINIYELAHKCKEWATSKGYSYRGSDGLVYVYYIEKLVVTILNQEVKNWFDVNIDFKACEWILKDKR